jgi:hypothetical protein
VSREPRAKTEDTVNEAGKRPGGAAAHEPHERPRQVREAGQAVEERVGIREDHAEQAHDEQNYGGEADSADHEQ